MQRKNIQNINTNLHTMKNKMRLKLNNERQLAFYITIITVLVSIGGYWYYGREKEQIIEQKEKTLTAIATLKAKQIEMWHKDELSDAQIISYNPYLEKVVKSFVRSNSPIDKAGLLELLKQIQMEHGFAEVFLTTLEGSIIAATNSQIAQIHPDELKTLKHAIQNEETVYIGFFNATPNGNKQYHISFISPLNNGVNNPGYAIVLRVDAAKNFQPLIESWPTESQTEESFIFNKETNRIILFNEPRHQIEIETKDKLEVKNDDLLSKIYTSGKPGIYTGKDYRNVEVLAYMQAIEGTNRVLISKIDKSELLQELKGKTLSVIMWVIFIVAISGLFIAFWFNTRQKNIYKGLLEKERELWVQQKKFDVVMDSIGDAIITIELNGKIQFLNKRAEEITGWNLREAHGRDFHEVYNVINEETGQQENNILDKVLKKGIVKELANHTILISKSGKEIPVMDTGAPLYDESGKVTGIAISFQDETEKRQQRRLLVESEKRYREFFEADLTGDYIATPDGIILQCNHAFIGILGYDTVEEIIGRNVTEFYQNPAERQELLTLIQNQKVIKNFTIKLKRKDGTNIICNENIVGKFDANGNLVQYLGFIYDITKQIHAEEELRKKDQLLSSVMETQQELICRYLPDTTHIFVNKAYCNLFCHSENELVGQKLLQFVPESEWNTKLSRIEQLNKRNPSITSISQAIKPDGSLISIEWTDVAIFNDRDEVVEIQSVGRDITEKLKAEQELIKAKEKAEESDRLKTAFLANVSHEIRTPMNGILGFTNLLLEPDLSSEEKEDFIKIVHQSGQRMLNTVTDIVEISKIEAGIVNVIQNETDINERLEELIRFFELEAEKKGLKLILKKLLPVENKKVMTDQNKLDSILTNLIKNAIKYTDTGTINVGCSQKGKEIEFYIKDTGIGIPAHRREAVFSRFEQADISDTRAFQGSGLGLAISKSYIEMLGGKIWMESEEGKGSTFYFTLPVKSNLEEKLISDKKTSVHNEKAKPNVKGLKILIAEDDEVSRQFLSILIKDFAAEILEAATGIDTVELCRQNKDIDLILMDIQMPELNGYEATRRIREFNKDVVIIAQTAFGLSGDREKAIESGCNDYISKPINKRKLQTMIQKYFGK